MVPKMYFKNSGIDKETGLYRITDLEDSDNYILANSYYLATSISDILNNKLRIINKKMFNIQMKRIEVKFVEILRMDFKEDSVEIDSLIYYDSYTPIQRENGIKQNFTDFDYEGSLMIKSVDTVIGTFLPNNPDKYKFIIGLDDHNITPKIINILYIS